MSTIPMFAPDGSTGDIPAANLQAAIKAGFKPAYSMTSPDGKTGYIPQDKYKEASDAGFKLNTEPGVRVTGTNPNGQPILGPEEEPSTASLYKEALTNPVGSGAHPQGLLGGLEQIGGRALNAIVSPLEHPLQTLGATAKMAADAYSGNVDLNNPLVQRAQEFGQEWQKSPALASENAAGDVVGGIEGGRLIGAAGEKAVSSPAGQAIINSAPIQTAKSLAGKMVPSLVDGPPESLITRAVKPGKNNVNWNADVQKALPLMKSAEEQTGQPISGVDDALEAANLAKKNIWQQYQQRLAASGQTGATIDGNQIADAMMKNIDNRTAVQNPQLVAKIQKIADTYRHPVSVGDAEDFLQSANKDLNSYYAKNKVGQNVALNDPEISSTVAEAAALRSALYGKLDQIAGPGAAQLKQAYGSLTNIEKELYGRQLVAARQNPESLSEQLSTVRGAGKIVKGVVTLDPGDVLEGAQNIAVSRALKARNSSDAMIARAFQKVEPAQPFPPSMAPRFAGMLPRGPIQTPAPADASGSIPYQAPPIAGTTRAQRLGLMLPAQTGGPIELPYVPQMTAGEQAAALMQYLRRRQQMVLPATASPIPLPGSTQ